MVADQFKKWHTHTKQHMHGYEQGILAEGSTIQEVNVESYIKYF